MAPVLLGLPTVFHCEIITMPVPVSLVVVQPYHLRNQGVCKSGNCLPQPSVAQPLPPHFLKNHVFHNIGLCPPLNLKKSAKFPVSACRICVIAQPVATMGGMGAQICRPCALLCFVCDVCVGST